MKNFEMGKDYALIYLIHCLNSITRSYKTYLHRASIKTLHIKLAEHHIIGLCREPIFQS